MQPERTIEKYLKKHPAAAEYRFLFACCRAAFAGTTLHYPDEVRPEVFLKIVQHHKLVPHLYPVLKSHCENVPDAVFNRFQQLFKVHNLHILKLSGELARLSRLFAANDIPWLSIKGPALSVQLYGDIAARQAHDIDILIGENDLEKAAKILTQAGYVATYDPSEFNPTQIQFWRKYYKDAFFTHGSKNIYIELHWRIVIDSHIFNDIDFFENIHGVTVANNNIPVLNDLTNIIYLCYHGGCHAWRRLFWLWDMARIIQTSPAEQIDKIINKAGNYGLTQMLGQTVFLANMLLGIEVPNQLKKIVILPNITNLALRFILDQNMSTFQQIFLGINYDRHILPPRDIKPLFAVALVNPIHWKTIRLPEKLFFLYYFLRPVAVILRKIREK
jgi:hypothetical protein